MEHSQKILLILREKNISAYRISKETGISESLFSKWNSRPTSEISSKNLVKIADYLNCSVDYLLGRSIERKQNETKLNEDEQKLLENYRSLPDEGRKYINETMSMVAKSYKTK